MKKNTKEILRYCKIARKVGGKKMERACVNGAISALENIPICPHKEVDKEINKILEDLHEYKFKKLGGIGGDLY